MELSKSGSVAAHFLFMSLENTYTEYLTAFGKFVFEIETAIYIIIPLTFPILQAFPPVH